MAPLHERLVEVAAKALTDRWGHTYPPGQLMTEDARVAVYAVLRELSAKGWDDDIQYGMLFASELDDAAHNLDHERFLAHYGGHRHRLPWAELQNWAKRQRLEREAEIEARSNGEAG